MLKEHNAKFHMRLERGGDAESAAWISKGLTSHGLEESLAIFLEREGFLFIATKKGEELLGSGMRGAGWGEVKRDMD
jgi:hypothetical protein